MSNRRFRVEQAFHLSLVLLCATVVGCAQRQVKPNVLPSSGSQRISEGPYCIQPGDELEIRFFYTPEINVLLPVRPDGRISLPLVHELQAAGLTVEELRLDLINRYRSELADPELAVIVKTFGSYLVHVGGHVGAPGVLELTGTRSVIEAVLAAGGFLPTADPSEVLVVRRIDPGGYELVKADLKALLAGRHSNGNFALRPYDVVYVPSTGIAEVNKWVDQYLRQNIPLTFSYRLD